jgi:hypothetical protein
VVGRSQLAVAKFSNREPSRGITQAPNATAHSLIARALTRPAGNCIPGAATRVHNACIATSASRADAGMIKVSMRNPARIIPAIEIAAATAIVLAIGRRPLDRRSFDSPQVV